MIQRKTQLSVRSRWNDFVENYWEDSKGNCSGELTRVGWTCAKEIFHKMSKRKPLKPEVGHLSMRTARKCPEAPQASKQTGSAARKSTIKCPKQAYSNLPNPAVRTLRIQITKKIQKNMLSNQIMYLQRQNLVLTFDYNWEEKWHKY